MDFEQVVARVAELRMLVKAQEEEISMLLGLLPKKPDSYPAGRYILSVRDNRRFDPATAQRALSAAKFKTILVAKPDSTKAKLLLSGLDYSKCQKSFGVIRDIKEVTDEEV